MFLLIFFMMVFMIIFLYHTVYLHTVNPYVPRRTKPTQQQHENSVYKKDNVKTIYVRLERERIENTINKINIELGKRYLVLAYLKLKETQAYRQQVLLLCNANDLKRKRLLVSNEFHRINV